MEKGSEYMSHARIYRICLLIVVVLTIIGGIFYFINYMERNTKVPEGTLVLNDAWKAQEKMQRLFCCELEEVGGIRWLETQKRYT